MKHFCLLTAWISVVLFSASAVYGQQEQLWGNYTNNAALANPALSGFDESLNAYIQARDQSPNIANSTFATTYGINAKINKLNSGIGGFVVLQGLGVITSNTTTVQLNYNYQFKIKDQHQFSVGVAARYIDMQIDFNRLASQDIPNYNPTNPTSNQGTTVSFNSGIAYSFKNVKAAFGISNLNNPSIKELEYNVLTHSYLLASYTWEKSEKLTLTPTFIVRHSKQATVADITCLAKINNKYVLGAGYRTSNVLVANAGVKISKRVDFLGCIEANLQNPSLGPNLEACVMYKIGQ